MNPPGGGAGTGGDRGRLAPPAGGPEHQAQRAEPRDDVESMVYLASAQDASPGGDVGYILRSRGSIAGLRASVARAIEDLNPEIAIEFTIIDRGRSYTVTGAPRGAGVVRV